MKNLHLILLFIGTALVSCDNQTSLQEYYVENQENKQFLAIDIPASLLTGDNTALDAEQKATLETIKKINLLGYPLNDKNKGSFEEEKEKLTAILQDQKYQTLMKYGGGNRSAQLYYLGEEDAIDELIVFGSDEERGFGIARVLGDDMDPEALIKLFRSFEKGDVNIQGLQELISLKN